MINKFKDSISKILSYSGILYLNSLLSQKKLTIITFHRVVPSSIKDNSPNKSMMTSVSQFDEFIKMVSLYANSFTLETAVSHIEYKMPFPPRSVVITFDDGYEDNYTHAFPILKKYNVPATIFLSTKYIDQNKQWFWWDEIEYFFTQNKGEKLKYNKNISPKLIDTINRLIDTQENKTTAVRTFIHDLYNITEKERETLIRFIQKEHKSKLMLTWNQIRSMTYLFGVGSHTVNHIFLNTLSSSELSYEFDQSKSLIEQETGRGCSYICYPAGFVTEKVIKQAKKSEYKYGVTTVPINNSLKTDPYLLNRKDSGYFFINNKLKKSYFFFTFSSFFDLFELIRKYRAMVMNLFNTFRKK